MRGWAMTMGGLAVLMASFGLVGVAAADDEEDKAPFNDVRFVVQATSCSILEVELAKLAQERASKPELKQFAAKMLTDHTKVNLELEQMAVTLGSKVPTRMMGKQQELCDKMKSVDEGVDFDKAYTEHMAKGHEMAVKAFTRATKEAKSPELRAYAVKTLPILKRHQELAKELCAETKKDKDDH